MDILCGDKYANSSRWSLSSDCHMDAVVILANICYIYASLIGVAYLHCTRKSRNSCLLPCNSARGLLSLFLLLIHVVELCDGVLGYSAGPRHAIHVIVTPAISLACCAAALLFLYHIESHEKSRCLFLTSILWLLCAVSRVLKTAQLAQCKLGVEHVRLHILIWDSVTVAALSVVDFYTFFLRPAKRIQKKSCEEECATYKHTSVHFFSKITFYWLIPLLRIGNSNPLELEDLGHLPKNEETDKQFKKFNEIYTAEKLKAKRNNCDPSLWKCYFKMCWPLFALGGLFKLLGDFVGLVGPLGISVIIDYVATIKTDLSVNEANQQTSEYYLTWKEFYRNGYVMGILIFISAIAQGTLSQNSTHLVNIEGIHLKNALQALVYNKALRLCVWNISDLKEEDSNHESRKMSSFLKKGDHFSSNKNISGTDIGTITNLISEDTFNIMSFFWIGHYIWAIPLKIGILMYFLYLKLGWSAIIGAAFCIITMTPLQFLIGKKMSNNSKLITEISDERLKKTNEVFQGIKLLKLYGWECIYGSQISKLRKTELKLLDKDSLYWALMTFLTHASSILVTLVTFAVYFMIEGASLSASNVFSGLALFNQLTVPLFIFPITVPIIISAMVSTRRLDNFLNLPEIANTATFVNHQEESMNCEYELGVGSNCPMNNAERKVSHEDENTNVDTDDTVGSVFGLGNIMEGEEETEGDRSLVCSEPEEEISVSVNNAKFSWTGDDTKLSLVVDSLNIPKGKLSVIVGRVGSGKSSLLSALLGEMNMLNGKIKWSSDTTVAYAAQKPWLINGTLRDNILFGERYRPRRYSKVIAACALQPDIDILPGRDLTEIGEKGINLSGGQKQRIAIARALYSQANVVILDDPLSALDYQVGKQVFEEGIKKLLLRQRRTVILVTHRLQLLTQSSQIIALENGCIRAQGSLKEIDAADPELVRKWKTMMSREVLEEERHKFGRTAKERWKLVKLVSRIGVQLKQKNINNGTWQTDEETHVVQPLFIPLRKRHGTFSGSRCYLTHDLPLPIDECEADFIDRTRFSRSSLKRLRSSTVTDSRRHSLSQQHKSVHRVSSLQTNHKENTPYPMIRQSSSPSMQPQESCSDTLFRTRSGIDSQHSGSFLRRLFSVKYQRTMSSAPEVSGSFKEKSVLRRFLSSSSTKSTDGEKIPARRLLSSGSVLSDDAHDEEETEDAVSVYGGRLISEEEREYGKISKKIYLSYMSACGVFIGCTYMVSAVVWQGLRVYTDYWLSEWTENSSGGGNNSINQHQRDSDNNTNITSVIENMKTHSSEQMNKQEMVHYFTTYAILSIVSILLSLSSNGIGQYAGAQARKKLHEKMLHNVLKCPMRFFESTPIGRIINRFSTDMGVIDKKIATSIQRLLQFLLLCFSAVLVNGVVTYWFLLIAVPICATYYIVQHFYRCSSRELQRLDSITRSPIFSHFSETLGGLTTIRAFQHQHRFKDIMLHKMDIHANAFLIMNSSNRWLGIALDYLGGVIVFIAIMAALLTVKFFPGVVSEDLVGLAINHTLLIPIYLNWVVKFLADMEMYMGAVERVEQYAIMPTEDYRKEGIAIPKSWPQKGDIVFENVSLRYDSKREPVFVNLSLHIPAGQKVGICGRTGCGKSSLVMSLFHMVDVYEGTIQIDGTDISKVPLQVLRSRLSVIPQDVIMFSGTIRENLDPESHHTDEELWKSLELAQLKDIVSSYPGGLDSEVREGGENVSAGQRQLFCLARAILHDAACLIMDEATSSVDPTTEKALLAAASQAFSERTVITIAHRLTTILNCDRILVLEGGRIVEDGSPSELMSHPMGIFTSMLRASESGNIST